MQLSKNFTLAELCVTTTGLANVPNQDEVQRLRLLATKCLQPLRDSLGRALVVNSAFRSAKVNAAVGGSSTSDHRTGQAADVWTDGMSSLTLAKHVITHKIPFDQLIYYPGTRRVHVSYREGGNRGQVMTAHANGRYTAGLPK